MTCRVTHYFFSVPSSITSLCPYHGWCCYHRKQINTRRRVCYQPCSSMAEKQVFYVYIIVIIISTVFDTHYIGNFYTTNITICMCHRFSVRRLSCVYDSRPVTIRTLRTWSVRLVFLRKGKVTIQAPMLIRSAELTVSPATPASGLGKVNVCSSSVVS